MMQLTAPTKRRTIRFWLNALVVACVLPAVIVASFILVREFNQERDSLVRDTIGTARALSQTVDAELTGVRSALLVLAQSSSLKNGAFADFYGEAKDLVGDLNGQNIFLTDFNGQQVVNTLRPFGETLPRRNGLEQLRRIAETGQPVISDLFVGALSGKPVVTVEVPVRIQGELRYSLGMAIGANRLSDILHRQNVPAGWLVGIVDNNETIVARSVNGDRVVGEKISAGLKNAIAVSREGSFEGLTREGVEALSSFSRSPVSGWIVAIGMPANSVVGSLRDALLFNMVTAIVLLAGGVYLARSISRRIAGSIGALREPAIGLGSSSAVEIPSTPIQEVHDLGQSILDARTLIDQRTNERNDLRRRIMVAQEQERLRLAHDLHDQTGQSVTAAILDLKAIESVIDEKNHGRTRLLRKQLEGIGQMLHRIAWELRPASIEELGLCAALDNYVSEWGAQNGIAVDFHCSDSMLDTRSDEICTTLYRLVQEALTNVAKHATGATSVSIVIGHSADTLQLTIEDNGCGFDPAAVSARLGIAGMRERVTLVGGLLEIESAPTSGTTIFVRIPIAPERDAA
ncbi:MAG: hypothetical protein JO254_10090 [Pseudolabrys sp.]|nr:hypothetical protein [Pseudolabrys sp.]